MTFKCLFKSLSLLTLKPFWRYASNWSYSILNSKIGHMKTYDLYSGKATIVTCILASTNSYSAFSATMLLTTLTQCINPPLHDKLNWQPQQVAVQYVTSVKYKNAMKRTLIYHGMLGTAMLGTSVIAGINCLYLWQVRLQVSMCYGVWLICRKKLVYQVFVITSLQFGPSMAMSFVFVARCDIYVW